MRFWVQRIIFLLLLVSVPAISFSQTLEQLASKFGEDIKDPKVKIAVMDFSSTVGEEQQDSIVVRERLTTFLALNKNITLIERMLLEKIFQEQKLQLSGVISPDTIKRIGELSGADVIITGTVNSLVSDDVEINARAIKVGTGEIISAGQSRIKKEWKYFKPLNTPGNVKVNADSAADYYMRAGQFYKDGKYGMAIEFYTKAITLKPDYLDAYYDRATIYVLQGKNNEAIVDLNNVLDLKLDYAEAYALRGRAYYNKEDYAQAIGSYNKAIELGIENSMVYLFRGFAYHCIREYDVAIKDYAKALSLDSSNADAYSWRGRAYSAKKEYLAAIADYTKAIQLRNYAGDYATRAFIYYSNGEKTKAINDANMAIKLEPDNAEGYYARGSLSHRTTPDKVVMADIDKAIELNPNHSEYYMFRARINHFNLFGKDGKTFNFTFGRDKAIPDYSRAIKIDPTKYDAYLERGKCYSSKFSHSNYVDTASFEKAISDFNKTIELKPENAEAYLERGEILGNKGDYALGLADCERGLELKPTEADGYECQGHVYKAKGEITMAIRSYTEAISRDPQSINLYSTRSVLYSQNGENDKADEDHKKTMELIKEWGKGLNEDNKSEK